MAGNVYEFIHITFFNVYEFMHITFFIYKDYMVHNCMRQPIHFHLSIYQSSFTTRECKIISTWRHEVSRIMFQDDWSTRNTKGSVPKLRTIDLANVTLPNLMRRGNNFLYLHFTALVHLAKYILCYNNSLITSLLSSYYIFLFQPSGCTRIPTINCSTWKSKRK